MGRTEKTVFEGVEGQRIKLVAIVKAPSGVTCGVWVHREGSGAVCVWVIVEPECSG